MFFFPWAMTGKVNSEIKVYTMQKVMSTRYIKSFYINLQGFTCWFRISNSIYTNTLKAEFDENIKSSKSRQLSRFYSAYLSYILVHSSLHRKKHWGTWIEPITAQTMVSAFWHSCQKLRHMVNYNDKTSAFISENDRNFKSSDHVTSKFNLMYSRL